MAGRIIENSVVPVLLGPEKFEWKELEQIFFATNYQKTDKQALSLILSMAKLYSAMVTVVYLNNVYLTEEENEENDFDTFAYIVQREFNTLFWSIYLPVF